MGGGHCFAEFGDRFVGACFNGCVGAGGERGAEGCLAGCGGEEAGGCGAEGGHCGGLERWKDVVCQMVMLLESWTVYLW